MREFIRHPSSIPIQLKKLDGEHLQGTNTLNNVSFGGVACFCDSFIDKGTAVRIKIEHICRKFEITGKVIWCREKEENYEIGIEFIASKDKLFLLRMVEQICHIEHYRQEVMKKENRVLSSEEAALEWIDKYADSFPSMS